MHLNLYFSNQFQLEGNFKRHVADLFIFFCCKHLTNLIVILQGYTFIYLYHSFPPRE